MKSKISLNCCSSVCLSVSLLVYSKSLRHEHTFCGELCLTPEPTSFVYDNIEIFPVVDS